MAKDYLFTSESVTEGHPDKLCDQISDGVLDAILRDDPTARVACEALSTTGLVMVAGAISTHCYVDIPQLVRKIVVDAGYVSSDIGFDGRSCSVLTSIHEQSGDIAMGVDDAFETRGQGVFNIGAGDQGLMFGYACTDTPELMPKMCIRDRIGGIQDAGVHRAAGGTGSGLYPFDRRHGTGCGQGIWHVKIYHS